LANEPRRPGRTPLPPNIRKDKIAVTAMVRISCSARHGGKKEPCASCRELLEYALQRLDLCPFGENKTACSQCPIHCYKPDMRSRIQDVMRFAGPRMVFYHPWMALRHWARRGAPPPPRPGRV
ncbi:MAG TPA: nitrous oxide-stimulated promoter family protein, partial [Elusimicrobiota bacterium]|nr:nitrous oxide-stimulated promoter family protein [Elusimicrobiota bacterium]